jgi:hypothetical protein
MHLKPTAGCQIPTLVFGFGVRTLCISHEKYIKNSKIVAHLGLRLKVLPGHLTDLRLWV